MRYIPRSVPPPAILTGSVAQLYRDGAARFMRQSGEQLSQHALMRSSLNLGHESMGKALNQLFGGRCAFCEAEVPTKPYRLRPFENAQPYQASEHAHLYYLWMDAAWQNFYAICSSCMPSNAGYFPVFGKRAPLPSLDQFEKYAEEGTGLWPDYPLKEKPVLLDPCVDRDLYKHIGVRTNGELVGLSERGLVTREHFSLNKHGRPLKRASAYQGYFQDLYKWVCHPEMKVLPTCFDFSDMKFGGTWYLLLRRFAILISAQIGLQPILSMNRIEKVFKSLQNRPDTEKLFIRCWARTESEVLEDYSGIRAQPAPPSNAMVKRVRIENFKSIEALEITLPTPRSTTPEEQQARTPALLILGENAAGKSSVLEAIALGLSGEDTLQSLRLDPKHLVLDPQMLGAPALRKRLAARIEIELSEKPRRTLRIKHGDLHISKAKGQAHIPVFAYGAFRQYQNNSTGASRSSIHNLFDGGVLANPQRWLLGLTRDRFAMVARALHHILSVDNNLDVIRRDYKRQQCFITTAQGSDHRMLAQSSLDTASSGFRSVLAMVCDIMRGMMDRNIYPDFDSLETSRAVVLIDEVEAHLHPRWKMQIMGGLRRALPKVTFIVTTHDPLCLRGMDDGETVVLRRVRVAKGTTAAGLPMQTELVTDLPPASELRVEQLLTSDLFQLHSTDDPEMEHEFAHVADLLALEKRDKAQQAVVDRFRKDVISALPIGTSEAHRLVQSAVAEYLQARANPTTDPSKPTREAVKKRIIEALEDLI
ncbi:AAA family ATPase [Pseudomonas wadenswilerensis]